ncbi:MAG: cyclase family protein [Conexivisphaerales archaeon]
MFTDLFENANVVELSHRIHEGMTVYIGDPVPKITRVKTIQVDKVNLSKVEMGVHNGTHIDAPYHFIDNSATADQIPVERLCGKAVTLDFSSKEHGSAIDSTDLERYQEKIRKDAIILLYTGVSKFWDEDWSRSRFTYLSTDGAEMLVSKGVKAVGIDCLSIERFGSKTGETHKTLLGNNIPIIESLNSNLSKLVGKNALLICMPLFLQGTDGAPARAIALLER